MNVVTIWSDLGCPWAYVACLRLHRMRDHLDATDVGFDFRARPTELFEPGAASRARRRAEVVALAQLEHTAFSEYTGDTWPATLMPAFEAQKWGYSLAHDIGESFDLALRRGLFLHSHVLSLRNELLAIAASEGLDQGGLARALDTGSFREQVMADAREAEETAGDGTPVVVLPDGTMHANPGITVEWVRGIPLVIGDHPSVYEDIIRSAATD